MGGGVFVLYVVWVGVCDGWCVVVCMCVGGMRIHVVCVFVCVWVGVCVLYVLDPPVSLPEPPPCLHPVGPMCRGW